MKREQNHLSKSNKRFQKSVSGRNLSFVLLSLLIIFAMGALGGGCGKGNRGGSGMFVSPGADKKPGGSGLTLSSGEDVKAKDGRSGSSYESDTYRRDYAPAPPSGEGTTAGQGSSSVAGRSIAFAQGIVPQKIIYEYWLRLRVEDVTKALDRAQEIATRMGGFIANSNLSSEEETSPVGTMVVRIPAERGREYMAELKGLGKVVSDKSTADEVTEEYIDLQARLRTLRVSEESLLALLRKQGRLRDLLEVEGELRQVREQIDRTKGRLNWLEYRIGYSTVNIEMWQKSVSPPPRFEWGFGGTAKDAFNAFLATTRFFSKVLIWVGVFSPLWLLAILLGWLIQRAARKKEPAKA